MLKYRINIGSIEQENSFLPSSRVTFADFDNLTDEEGNPIAYDGPNKNKIMVTCECDNINNIKNGGFVRAVNRLFLSSGLYEFNDRFQVVGTSDTNRSFSFFIDKYRVLNVSNVLLDENYKIRLHCEDYHYFDENDNLIPIGETEDVVTGEITIENKQEIPVYFKYTKYNQDTQATETFVTVIKFRYLSEWTLITDKEAFDWDVEIPEVYLSEYIKFNEKYYKWDVETMQYSEIEVAEEETLPQEYIEGEDYVKVNDTYYEWNTDNEEYVQITVVEDRRIGLFQMLFCQYGTMDLRPFDYENSDLTYSINGTLSGINIYRENFLFSERSNYSFLPEGTAVNIPLPLSNSFETNLYQSSLLKERFVDEEKRKSINSIVDLEKDVYYPVIAKKEETIETYTDVYTIKFNLHFREHRTDDWNLDGNSFWNGVVDAGENEEHKYEIYKIEGKPMTQDNASDLLSYLHFTNDDIRFQKNKLKKSFLRLSFFDSTNPANQNLLGYSTVFVNSADLFAKYVKRIETGNYLSIKADYDKYGTYSVPKETYQKIRNGVKVDREPCILNNNGELDAITFDENLRLSSQITIKSKNTSLSSSEGFYLYLWKDNESALPQDIYMKVEYNHAGFGRTIPFMMPYWDKDKWANDTEKRGIKTFKDILEDWSDTKNYDNSGNAYWENGTDGHYNISQYNNFSYIHLKYRYDMDNDKHIYYIDPDTYGNIGKEGQQYIEINLYEAKVE